MARAMATSLLLAAGELGRRIAELVGKPTAARASAAPLVAFSREKARGRSWAVRHFPERSCGRAN